jgi:hypothetical protein
VALLLLLLLLLLPEGVVVLLSPHAFLHTQRYCRTY